MCFPSRVTFFLLLLAAVAGCGEHAATTMEPAATSEQWSVHEAFTLRSASLGPNDNVESTWKLPRGEYKYKLVFEKPKDEDAKRLLLTYATCRLVLGNDIDTPYHPQDLLSEDPVEPKELSDGAVEFAGDLFLGRIAERKGNDFSLRLSCSTEVFAKRVEFSRETSN